MKLTWSNISNVYLTKNGNLRHRTRGIIYEMGPCVVCGEMFLGKQKDKCCSRQCSTIITSGFHRGKKRSEETKRKISEKAKQREPHKKHDVESISKEMSREGYNLLSNTYINNKAKLKILCPKGHLWEASYFQFQQGNRCLECSGKKKQTLDYIREYVDNQGYRLLSNNYNGALSKLKLECSNGHKFTMKWNNFQQGQRCPICYSLSKPYKYEWIKDCIEKEGYKLLSNTYRNTRTKLKIECDKGHIYKASYNSFQQGQRCPICYANCTSSKMEKELQNIVDSITKEIVVFNDRTQLLNSNTGRYLELDIWIPSMRKAIEFNGTYWHSIPKTKRLDNYKKELCKSLDINLYVIKEDQWLENKSGCIENIKEWLNEDQTN